ncbi:MAG: dephospho-CoA kinase [Flavobacterium sp.]|uniref:dephospho-CoA kinase n=1 Tax=Flavobacterium sp. TaxID=239 RepID=UPI003BEC2E16
MTKIVGLTGGIGSGKTMIANYLKSSGIPVYIADEEAKKIMNSSEVVETIKNQFGNEVFDGHVLNREKLAQLVFDYPDKLQKLNAIIHPKVLIHFENWLKKQNHYPFIVKEAAILFESGSYKKCDKIITVIAPLETRIERVLKRDNMSRENIIKRLQNQWTDEQRVAKSHFVVDNISIEDSHQQIDEILKILKNQ